MAAASSYWGATPCHGDVLVRWQSNVPASPVAGTTIEAWVTFQTPQGPSDFAAPPSTYTECVVNVSRKHWPTLAVAAADHVAFCQMMVHEFGHFEGYSDSLAYSRSDVRYPLLTAANVPAVCHPGAGAGGAMAGAHPQLRGFERS
jgi:hypothetical protein